MPADGSVFADHCTLHYTSLQLEKEAVVKDVEQAKKEIKDGLAKLVGQDVALGDYAKVSLRPPTSVATVWRQLLTLFSLYSSSLATPFTTARCSERWATDAAQNRPLHPPGVGCLGLSPVARSIRGTQLGRWSHAGLRSESPRGIE